MKAAPEGEFSHRVFLLDRGEYRWKTMSILCHVWAAGLYKDSGDIQEIQVKPYKYFIRYCSQVRRACISIQARRFGRAKM